MSVVPETGTMAGSGLMAKGLWLLPVLFFVLLPFGGWYNLPLLLLALAGMIYLIRNFDETVHDRNVRLYLLLFLCIFVPMLLSLPDAIHFGETLRKAASFAIYIFTGIAVIRIYKNECYGQYFIIALGIVLTLWTIDALWQYIHGENFFGYPRLPDYAPGGGRLSGIFYPELRIGILMAILSPFYFEFVRLCQRKFFLSWLLAVPFVLVIILAGSRMSWVMLMLSGMLYFIYFLVAGYRQEMKLRTVVAGAVIIIAGLAALYQTGTIDVSRFQSFITARIASASYDPADGQPPNAIEQRVALWESSLRVTKDHWLNGIGVRGYRYLDLEEIDRKPPVISERAILSTHPHQITLEILLETGIIGLAGFVLFWIVLMRIYLPVFKNRERLPELLWIFPVVIAVFPLNMHKSFYEHFSSAIIWLLVALAMAVCREDKRTAKLPLLAGGG